MLILIIIAFEFSELLDLAFNTKALRQLCTSESIAKRDLGDKIADLLKHRLADLRASACVKELIAGNPRELATTENEQFIVDLGDRYSIVFTANHRDKPLLKSGKIDWSEVSRIKILKVGSIYD